MARDALIAVSNEWTQLTAGDVSAITFQNQGTDIVIRVAVGATAPADTDGLIYPPKTGEANTLLAELAPGITGGNRVYARSPFGASVWVSHD